MEPSHPSIELEPRRPAPDRRVDLYLALGAATVASLAYLVTSLTDTLPSPGFAVALLATAALSAGFALTVLVPRGRMEGDEAISWTSAGVLVAMVAMVLQVVSFPVVARLGGPLGTTAQGSAGLYLWLHLALAVGAGAGALGLHRRWRWPVAAGGIAVAVLVALGSVPLPVMLRPDERYTAALVGAELALAVLTAGVTVLWVRRAGRAAPTLRGWVGVALSLSTYDLLLNAMAGQRFNHVWWASMAVRVATYAVLAVGAVVGVLSRLGDVEIYSEAELDRREGQLRSSLHLTGQLLASADQLARAVTPTEVAEAICGYAVQATGLRYASLLLRRRDEALSPLGSAGYDADLMAELADVDWDDTHPSTQVLVTGEPVYLSAPRDIRARFAGAVDTPLRRAAVAAALPIRVGERPMATLVVWDRRPRPWTALAKEVLAGLVAQGGQALHRALAFEEEATTAATLQRALLPAELPQRAGLELAARYVPGERGLRVGGDWYDGVEVDGDRVALVVGDVMGKGLRAASVMGQARTALRSLALTDPAPTAVLAGLDRMAVDLESNEIATVVYVLLDLHRGAATLGRAGHLPPILVGPDGRAELLEAGGSPPLGLPPGLPPGDRAQAGLPVVPGSLLVLYTDGIVENRTQALDGLPGFVRLVGELAARHAHDLEALADALLARTCAAERDDDVALLLARYTGPPTGPAGEP